MELSSWQHQPIVPNVSSIRRVYIRELGDASPMGDGLKLIWWAIIRLVRSRVSLEAEILSLRHQFNVLEENRRSGSLSAILTVWFSPALYQFAPRIVNALAIVVSIVRHWLDGGGIWGPGHLLRRHVAACLSTRRVAQECGDRISDPMTLANLPAERAPRSMDQPYILSMVDIATGEASDSEPTCAHCQFVSAAWVVASHTPLRPPSNVLH